MLELLIYPDPRLRKKAKPVLLFDSTLREQARQMALLMYRQNGIGLAAVQVNLQLQMIVVDVTANRTSLKTLINPKIIDHQGEQMVEEGCLSLPDVFAQVKRYESISLSAYNLEGKEHKLEADGMEAVCIQHEMDHLNGIVFVDYLSRLKRERIEKQLLKKYHTKR